MGEGGPERGALAPRSGRSGCVRRKRPPVSRGTETRRATLSAQALTPAAMLRARLVGNWRGGFVDGRGGALPGRAVVADLVAERVRAAVRAACSVGDGLVRVDRVDLLPVGPQQAGRVSTRGRAEDVPAIYSGWYRVIPRKPARSSSCRGVRGEGFSEAHPEGGGRSGRSPGPEKNDRYGRIRPSAVSRANARL